MKTPLLISGGSGTQKISLAAATHARSESSNAPLITINAKNAREQDLREKFFNEDDGPSETIESARDGALLIANVDYIPLSLQAPLGNLIRDPKSDIRIIRTCSRDLEKQIDAGQLEDSLFFRISTNVLNIHSLRDRSEDLPAMALAYLNTHGLS